MKNDAFPKENKQTLDPISLLLPFESIEPSATNLIETEVVTDDCLLYDQCSQLFVPPSLIDKTCSNIGELSVETYPVEQKLDQMVSSDFTQPERMVPVEIIQPSLLMPFNMVSSVPLKDFHLTKVSSASRGKDLKLFKT